MARCELAPDRALASLFSGWNVASHVPIQTIRMSGYEPDFAEIALTQINGFRQGPLYSFVCEFAPQVAGFTLAS
jgi:hypothetical protein